MFLDYFGLIEQPFGVTPDPRFLHMGAKHREALASLVYGTESNRGFLALIAEPGMGKTSLLLQFLERQRGKSRSAFVFHTDADSHDFMRHILADLGLDGSGKDQATMRGMLNSVLMAEMHAGRRFILVIDEAQNLDERVLESVRLLSNFETPWTELIQIVIAGQPQLAERLTRLSMAQLRQRISSVIRLEPFTAHETDTYIDHRLWVAGYSGAPLFTAGARSVIARRSHGIPRNINNLCFNAMSIAYGAGIRRVNEKIVREATEDVEMESLVAKSAGSERIMPNQVRSIGASEPSGLATKHRRIDKIMPAFAALCVVMLALSFSWLGWSQGSRTPPFDVLFAANNPPHIVVTGQEPVATVQSSVDIKPDGAIPAGSGTLSPPPLDSVRAGKSFPANLTYSTNSADDKQAFENSIDAESSQPSIVAGLSDNDRILTVDVQKQITLLDLSIRHLGRFDSATLEKTLELNPTLTNMNRIEPGQRIRLPLYLRDSFQLQRYNAADTPPRTAAKERP